MKKCCYFPRIRPGIEIAVLLLAGAVFQCRRPVTELEIRDIEKQVHLLDSCTIQRMEALDEAGETQEFIEPRSLNQEGELVLVPSQDWCSGFFPGILWTLYELTGGEMWKTRAEYYTQPLQREQWNGTTHDMGFKMMCSFGNGYRLTGNPQYREILVRSANTLATRFNEKVGCIKSWDSPREKWQFPVIIDNMMNLELLFWATRETGDSAYYDMAVTHAWTTLRNHFRTDNSSWHVVDYDTLTGDVRAKQTHQGYSDASSWARGQSWGLYGYTMAYRETGIAEFLIRAEQIAGFLLNHPNLPDDGVPYWDYDAPGIPDEPRDVSAAAVMASALYELGGYAENGNFYREAADRIMESLSSSPYRSPAGANRGFILDHSVGSKPGNGEVDVPIIYADYYFLEALKRKN